ncbi:ATP-binding cassette domain-containing protein [Alcanivorax sp. IO_7]|nr:ATP-binding cassette domain-containing protein [Alcanivorax sp. IO_7]
MNDALLNVAGVTVRAGDRALLSEVSFQARAGERLALLGPNGAGKSTLMRALAGDLTPDAGTVRLGGRPLTDWPVAELARRRSVMMQHTPVGFPVRADEVVALGLPGRRHGNAADPLVGSCWPVSGWRRCAPGPGRPCPVASNSGYNWPGCWPRCGTPGAPFAAAG